MPTERFYNLNEEKRASIERNIFDEFLVRDYGEIRLSHLIRASRISRGSLYTYFSDKEDIFLYLVRQMKNDVRARFIGCLKEDGNFCSSFIHVFQQLLAEEDSLKYCRFYLKVMKDEVCRKLVVRDETEFQESREFRQFIHECQKWISKSLYSELDEQQLICLMDLISAILNEVAAVFTWNMEKRITVQMDMIQSGMRNLTLKPKETLS